MGCWELENIHAQERKAIKNPVHLLESHLRVESHLPPFGTSQPPREGTQSKGTAVEPVAEGLLDVLLIAARPKGLWPCTA